MEHATNISQFHIPQNWNAIWRLKVSSKICVFVMESDEGVPSHKTKTFKEGVCNICETDLENE
ncbi:hypothetical protein HKD37_11G030994 [Glycine soja]|nr:hypothetical protein JHK86_030696 [Glycine max]KAH1224376.1 hypothetical protein GmHk_11G031577 [Glycine max]